MFLVTSNKSKHLLFLNYIQQVKAEELKSGLEDVKTLLAELPTGFRVLADFGQLESMELACAAEIGKGMELFDQNGVGMVVRVMPHPSKDIGINILTAFHYRNKPHVVTCKDMTEAAKALALQGG